MSRHFIDHKTALTRVARNYDNFDRYRVEHARANELAARERNQARMDAIVQTWAEVRNLPFETAKREICDRISAARQHAAAWRAFQN